MNSRKLCTIALCILLMASLQACSKVTQENYDKISMGMDRTEVEDILGKADACQAALGTKSCTWGDEKKNITIQFIADKVVFYGSKGL